MEISDEELGRRVREAMKRLDQAGISHRRHFNELTEAHFGHAAHNFRIGFETGFTGFEVWNMLDMTWETPAFSDRHEDRAIELCETLERAATYLENLSPQED